MTKIVGDAQIFNDIVSAVLVMQTEARVFLTLEGLKINVGSHDHTAAVFITAPKALFDVYEVTEAVEFGIKADEFKKRLAHLEGKITLTVDEQLKISSEDTVYTIPLFEVEAFKHEPEMAFGSSFTLPYEQLAKIVKKVAVVTDTIKIETKGKGILFRGRGDLPSDVVEVSLVEQDVKGEAVSAYLLSYLKTMVEAVKVEKATVDIMQKGTLRLILGNVVYLLGGKMKQ